MPVFKILLTRIILWMTQLYVTCELRAFLLSNLLSCLFINTNIETLAIRETMRQRITK